MALLRNNPDILHELVVLCPATVDPSACPVRGVIFRA
jgi:hypothetical protein